MIEMNKTALRRSHDPEFAKHYFWGNGIDISVGDDPLKVDKQAFPFMGNVTVWGKAQGDALYMKGVEENRYDFVHSAYCLQYLANPMQAVARWLEIAKAAGHVIITVPNGDLCEQGQGTISFTAGKSRGGRSVSIPDLVSAMLPVASCERVALIREFHDEIRLDADRTAQDPAESAIEIVFRKRVVPSAQALMDEAMCADNAEASFAACRRALELYPYRFSVYHDTMRLALRWQMPAALDGMWDRAVKCLPERHTGIYQCLHEMQRGRLQKGFRLREALISGDRWQVRTSVQPPVNIHVWTGQPLAGKSIVIWDECGTAKMCGLGDEIFFFRFARVLREHCGAARVAMVCQPALLELFSASGEADVVVDNAHTAGLPPHDYWVYPHAIPAHLPLDLDALPPTLPYLRTPQKKSAAAALDPKTLKVGVVFKGGAGHSNDYFRSLPSLSVLDSLFDLDDIEFFSLQKGAGIEETAKYAQQRKNFHDLGPSLQTMADTAAAIADLDLLVTADTSVAHVAAAMGKPVWIMLPMMSDWRWHYLRKDSPWYPSVRLFRKGWGDPHDWTAIVTRIRDELILALWNKGR